MPSKVITPHALYDAVRNPAAALEVRGISPYVFFSLSVYQNGVKSLISQLCTLA